MAHTERGASSLQARPPRASRRSRSTLARAARRRGRQRGFDAGLPRPAHPHRAARRREEEAQAPHRLYGHVDGAVNYSVGHYLRDAAAVLADARARGRCRSSWAARASISRPWSRASPTCRPSRRRCASACAPRPRAAPRAALHAELAAAIRRGPLRLRPSDRLRVLRALEVLAATGRPLASLPGPHAGPGRSADAATPADLPRARNASAAPAHRRPLPRDDRRRRARRGARRSPRAGSIRCCRSCAPTACRGCSPICAARSRSRRRSRAARRDTRRYAKRQFTWFRHQMPGWTAVAPEAAPAALDDLIKSFET